MGKKLRKPVTAPSERLVASESAELPERWSVQRKTEVVVCLLRGEALDAVSRESQIPTHELESWKRVFRDIGTRGLRTRRAGGARAHARPSEDRGVDDAARTGRALIEKS